MAYSFLQSTVAALYFHFFFAIWRFRRLAFTHNSQAFTLSTNFAESNLMKCTGYLRVVWGCCCGYNYRAREHFFSSFGFVSGFCVYLFGFLFLR